MRIEERNDVLEQADLFNVVLEPGAAHGLREQSAANEGMRKCSWQPPPAMPAYD
jgi:hypothetical protein